LGFLFIFGFSIQFLNTISKASSLCSTKALNQEDSKLVDHGVKKALFFTPNAIILQFIWSTFLQLFPRIILIVQARDYG
jgi:hypothetical protein